jgi:predicted PurR-regulated permease PerM
LPPVSTPPPAARLRRLPITALVVTVAVLFFAREVLIPLALALLFSFLLGPLVRRVERIGLGRVSAVLAVTALFFCLFGAFGWLMTRQVIDLAAKAPSYQENIRQKFSVLRHQGGTIQTVAKVIENAQKEPEEAQAKLPPDASREDRAAKQITKAIQPEATPMPVKIIDPPPTPPQFIQNVVGPLLGPLGMAGIVILFTIFMLIQYEDLRDRFLHLVGPERLPVTTQAVDDAGRRVSRYLQMQVVVNICFGVVVGVGLFFIHVPNYALWGLLACIFRFVPYIGPWIGALFPTALSLAAFQSWHPVLLTLGLFVVAEIIISNAVEPWLYGSSTGLSPVAIVVSATFWTWLWGGVGLLLATPLTVCIVVLGRYVPQLEFLHTILGDEPVVPTDVRLYQRLLAFDQEEASELIDEHLKTHSLGEFYDQVFIPALNHAQIDAKQGSLNEEREQFIRQTAGTLIEDLRDRPMSDFRAASPEQEAVLAAAPAESTAKTAPPPVSMLILPVKTEGDQTASLALAHLLSIGGVGAEVAMHKSLVNEMVEAVGASTVRMVCISALRPFPVLQARHLAKRLRAQFPDLKIIIGLWDSQREPAAARQNLEASPADWVVNTFAEASQIICQSLPSQPVERVEIAPLVKPEDAGKAQPLVETAK